MQHIMDIKQQGDWWRVVCSCGWRDPAKYVNSSHASQAKRVGPASAHIAPWVKQESLRRFPLDLEGRVAWIREMAETAPSPDDSAAIFRLLDQVRNGVEA